MSRLAWTLVTATLMLASAPGVASGQSPAARFPTVLWSSCDAASATSPLTLHDIAVRARPALWFSRDEPLLDLDGPLPREWPRRDDGDRTLEDVVYYRVTRIKSASSDRDLVRTLHERVPADVRAHITPLRANPEVIATVPLDLPLLRQLKEVVIRYLFYYPSELGAHSHVHDLESVELRIVFEDADERGNPRTPEPACRQIRVATLYGAAHGLGLYTNVLDLDLVMNDRLDEGENVVEGTSRRTPVAPGRTGQPSLPTIVAAAPSVVEKLSRTDPFWPLIVLVEEGKHASAPDRNGDGVFTPNYDVNRYSADAWGVRDTMRSRQLSPAFRSDTFKRRIPEVAVDENGVIRAAQTQDLWAIAAFNRYVRYDYLLRRTTEDREICGDPMRDVRERVRSMQEYAEDLTARLGQGHAEGLLAGKGFCNDVTVHSRVNPADLFGRVSFGGAYNGFTRWWERISGSVRFDGGTGFVATVPIGLQVPGLGGWVVGRFSLPFPGTTTRKSLDVAFMPSASRFADWYVAGGIDYGSFESLSSFEAGKRFAIETGVKFRFPLPNWGTFLGGRIGIRANGKSRLQNPRIVFELGAGIW